MVVKGYRGGLRCRRRGAAARGVSETEGENGAAGERWERQWKARNQAVAPGRGGIEEKTSFLSNKLRKLLKLSGFRPPSAAGLGALSLSADLFLKGEWRQGRLGQSGAHRDGSATPDVTAIHSTHHSADGDSRSKQQVGDVVKLSFRISMTRLKSRTIETVSRA